MSRFDGNIVVGTSVDVGGINTGLNKITGAFNKLARQISNGPLTKLFSEAASAASDLVEVQNVVDVSFENMSWKAERFAKNAIQQFGMSELAAKRTASSFMAMGKAADIGMENASNMAVNLAALSGDFASFYNISQDYARVALSAVYTGETETLKRYGIILTEANLQQYALTQGIEKNVKTMNAREKLILRYMYVMEKTKDMQGDFVRTQESFANQTRLLSQTWNQFLIVLGHGVTTVGAPVLKWLSAMVVKLRQFTQIILSILGNIFGIDFSMPTNEMNGYADGVEDAAAAEEDLADATGKATKAAWKALAPFDELNVLRTPSSGGGGAGGGGDIFADFNADALWDFADVSDEVLSSLIDNWYDFGKWLSDGFTKIINGIPWQELWAKARAFGRGVAEFLNGIFQPSNFYKWGRALANALNTIIYAIQSFAKKFDFEKAGKSIGNFINGIIDNFDFDAAGDTIRRLVKGVEKLVYTVLKTVKWKKLIAGIFTILKQIPWEVYLAVLVGLVAKLLSVVIKKLITPVIANAIRGALSLAIKNIPWTAVFTTISSAFSSFFTRMFTKQVGTDFVMEGLGIGSKASKLFSFTKTVTPVSGMTEGVESATGLYKIVYDIWTMIQNIGSYLATLNTMDVAAIFGGQAGIAGGAIAVGEIILAALGGFFAGKDILGPLLDPEDKDWYKEFSFFGNDGFFATIVTNFASISTAINDMYTDLDGLAFYLDPITAFGEAIEKLIDAFKKGDAEGVGTSIFEAMLSAINTLIPPLTSIEYLFNRFAPDEVKQKIMDFFTNIGDKAVQIKDLLFGFFQQISDDFYTYVFEPIADKVVLIWQKIQTVTGWITNLLYGVSILIQAGIMVVWQAFSNGMNLLWRMFYNKVVVPIKTEIKLIWELFTSTLNMVGNWFMAKVVVPIKGYIDVSLGYFLYGIQLFWTKLNNLVTLIHEQVIVPILGWIQLLWSKVSTFFTNMWNTALTFITDLWNKIKTGLIDPIVTKVTGAAKWFYDTFIKPTVDNFSQAIEDIKTAFNDLWDNIKGGAKNVFNAVLIFFETMINWVIDKLNDFTSGFNIAVTAAAKMTGNPWHDLGTISHIKLPQLANGAVIPPNAPFLAMLGDQRHGTNVETPLDTIKQAVVEAMASGGFGGSGDIHIHCDLDGREIARAVVKQNAINRKSKGRDLI